MNLYIQFIACIMIYPMATAALANDSARCKEISDHADNSGIYVLGSDSEREVIGKGRLQFYSGPDARCIITGIFIVPKDKVNAYTEYKNYVLVVYMRAGEDTMGWVPADRLKPTGLGIAPKQP